MAVNSESSRSAGCRRRKFKLPALAAVICIIAAAPDSVRAQDADGIAATVHVVAWGDAIADLSFETGASAERFIAKAFSYSAAVSYKGPPIMEIHQLPPATASDGQAAPPDDGGPAAIPPPRAPVSRPATPEPAASPDDPDTAAAGLARELAERRLENPSLVALARIPAGCTRATILLAPAGDGTFRSYVINDDPSRLPLGGLRIQNLSPLSIAIKLPREARPREVKANQAITLDAPEGHVIYELFYQVEGEWKFQENNIITVRPNEQTQMIVLRSENQFFVSSDGSTGGTLQMVTLRRTADPQ